MTPLVMGSGALAIDVVKEVSTPVLDVLAWLSRVSPETAAVVLVGCGFHDGQSGELDATMIDGVDVARATITLSEGVRVVSLRRFRDGEFIDTRPGAPLAAAIAASRTPAEVRDEAERLAVRRAGFDPGKLASGDARRAVLAMVALEAAEKLPEELQRAAFYDAVRAGGDAGTARVGARVLGRVCLRFEASDSTPEDLHWRRAALLRQAGDWRAAVEAAGVLYTRPELREETRLYLASTMAGSLLDLAGVRPTPALLGEAERALKVAWAISPGDEGLRVMWQILDRVRGNGNGNGHG